MIEMCFVRVKYPKIVYLYLYASIRPLTKIVYLYASIRPLTKTEY